MENEMNRSVLPNQLQPPALPLGPNPLDILNRQQQGFSMRNMDYRQGPPMERLAQRRKTLELERNLLTDKLNKIDAAIKLLESHPELAKTLDALADVGVL